MSSFSSREGLPNSITAFGALSEYLFRIARFTLSNCTVSLIISILRCSTKRATPCSAETHFWTGSISALLHGASEV
ncbi:hypothetical protein [Culturomica massiliensis]|uniref:hypothetical protein n=1 Tax=Culturomica massiliensis TaxID=1841857 RepID=UPI001F2D6A79|nr:hypothetical protein [Culturomica massiliensis]